MTEVDTKDDWAMKAARKWEHSVHAADREARVAQPAPREGNPQ